MAEGFWACPRPSAMRALPSSRRSHIPSPRDHRQGGGRSPPETCRHSGDFPASLMPATRLPPKALPCPVPGLRRRTHPAARPCVNISFRPCSSTTRHVGKVAGRKNPNRRGKSPASPGEREGTRALAELGPVPRVAPVHGRTCDAARSCLLRYFPSSLSDWALCLIAANDFGGCGGAGRWVGCRKRLKGPEIGVSWGPVCRAGAPQPCQAGTRANSRLMFQAMVTRLHSPRAPSRPRSEN